MPSSGLTSSQLQKFNNDGLLVVEDFLTESEVTSLKESCHRLVTEMDPKEHRGVFSTTTHNQAKDKYFLESGDKIRFFFEKNSFDDGTGELTMPKHTCINKIGHALHWLEPNFKKVTFSEKMKEVARSLGLRDPVVVQGMYIFKQPRIGEEVTPHQDGSFLRNEPLSLFGFWFPLDDATVDNGCLWYAPGSHRMPVTRNFVRTCDDDRGDTLLTFEGLDPTVADDAWVAAPVKKGSLVLIHGQVMHKSAQNTSNRPRHAYTFHMVESDGHAYSDRNWLQPTQQLAFPKLFEN